MNRPSLWRAVAVWVLAWTTIALLRALQEAAQLHYTHQPVHFWPILGERLLQWYTAGAITPFYVLLVRRLRRYSLSWTAMGAIYAAAIVAGFCLKAILYVPLENLIFHGNASLAAGLAYDLFSESFGFAAIFAAVIAIEHYRSLVETEQRASRLEKDLAEMQLQMLRAQIDPHFLFNALNGISALIETDPAGAQEMLSRLSALLRLALAAGSSQEVPLRDELIFVERYLDIMRVRFGERLQTCIDVSHDLLDERVPSLLLQPLVENCVRHGMHASPKTTTIDVTAVRDARSLRLTVTDDGTGLGPHPPRANGIGLGHTRRRLHHLYGDGATLHVADRPGGGTAVTITLPRREVVRYE